jgi:hypothetical protein
MEAIEEGGARETRGKTGGAAGYAKQGRGKKMVEVGGDPDSWAPPVSGRKEKKREKEDVGMAGCLRWAAWAALGPLRACEREERRPAAWSAAG